jgi:hypothetical protein
MRIDRNPLAEPDELVAPTACRTLKLTIAFLIEEPRDTDEPVRGGDAAQKITIDPPVFQQRAFTQGSDGRQIQKRIRLDRPHPFPVAAGVALAIARILLDKREANVRH